MSRHSKEASLCRVLISAGGTGGHIFPALAVAEYLRRKWACELLFVGAKQRMEMKIVPKAGFAIVGLPIRGFQRGQIWANLSLLWQLLASLWQAYGLLFRFRPDVLFGTGGYASLPVLWAGATRGLPMLILEPNAWAGWTNRLLGRYANKICVSYPQMDRFFAKRKLIYTGTPLRKQLQYLDIEEKGRRHLGLQPQMPAVLVIGGSLGSATLNRCLLAGWQPLLEAGYQIIWQTGSQHYASLRKAVGEKPTALHLSPFLEHIEEAYAAATLIVARAGALTIAELLQVGKPTILVPAPHVAEDHQRHNAEILARKGAVRCILDTDADTALLPSIKKLMQDPAAREALRKGIATLAPKGEATTAVAKEILSLSKKKSISHVLS